MANSILNCVCVCVCVNATALHKRTQTQKKGRKGRNGKVLIRLLIWNCNYNDIYEIILVKIDRGSLVLDSKQFSMLFHLPHKWCLLQKWTKMTENNHLAEIILGSLCTFYYYIRFLMFERKNLILISVKKRRHLTIWIIPCFWSYSFGSNRPKVLKLKRNCLIHKFMNSGKSSYNSQVKYNIKIVEGFGTWITKLNENIILYKNNSCV